MEQLFYIFPLLSSEGFQYSLSNYKGYREKRKLKVAISLILNYCKLTNKKDKIFRESVIGRYTVPIDTLS